MYNIIWDKIIFNIFYLYFLLVLIKRIMNINMFSQSIKVLSQNVYCNTVYYHCNASLRNRVRRINKDRQPNGCSLYKAIKVNEYPLTSIILKFLNLFDWKFIVNSVQFSFFAQPFLLDISRTIVVFQFFYRLFSKL